MCVCDIVITSLADAQTFTFWHISSFRSLEANSQTSINSSGSQSTSTPPPPIPSYCPQGSENDDAPLSHIYESTECCKPPSATIAPLEISEAAEREEEDGEERGREGEWENEQQESDQNGKSTQDNNSFEEGETMRALYSYQAGDEDELTFAEGDEVQIVERCDGGWAKAFLGDEFGYVPESYFELVKWKLHPTPFVHSLLKQQHRLNSFSSSFHRISTKLLFHIYDQELNTI